MKIIHPNGTKIILDEATHVKTDDPNEWEFWTKDPEKRGAYWVASLEPKSGILVVSDDFYAEIKK